MATTWENFFMHPLIDLHCDTIYRLHEQGKTETIVRNVGHTDLRWMEKAGNVTTCFALFTQMQGQGSPWQSVVALYNRFNEELASTEGRLQQIRTASALLANKKQGAVLSIEESQILEGDLERVETLSQWGVRMASLTWNHENDLGYPHHKRGGLKPFGFRAVTAMEHCNILVDVSHLNDEGIKDVLSVARRPVVASHSNCRYITNTSRNLKDGQIRSIAQTGGVVGLNFCPSFLSYDWMHSRLEDMVRHVLHLYKVGGEEVLAIGTDFDGISGSLELAHYPQLTLLWDALCKAGLKPSTLERMWFYNALRVLS